MTEKQPIKPEKEASEAELELRKAQLKILESFGTIDFDPNYDYKAERNIDEKISPESNPPSLQIQTGR